ncbi:MAG: 2OG-Fe(II) oxygenase [Pseudomonadota bacterium]
MKLKSINWSKVSNELDQEGFAVIESVLSKTECGVVASLYDNTECQFRSTIKMARYNFGKGEYKYFDYPLPKVVQELRERLYTPLANIANQWADKLHSLPTWPATMKALLCQCRGVNQVRPTPLLLKYEEGDYNCLHQDLYGEIHFPLQVIVMLSHPREFSGGQLTLVEQRPRMQSRPMVLTPGQGDAVILPVRERPRLGTRGYHRVQIRHGVSKVTQGRRMTLGVIFHDAR